MIQPKYRHEFKHYINIADYFSIRQRIKTVASLDPNSGEDGRYHIRSLYFDNDSDKALKEKLYGLPNREKFRIRLYNGMTDYIRLEKKSKFNGLCNKQSAKLTKEQSQSLVDGNISWMKDCREPLILELYGKMRFQGLKPKTIVDYWREAYLFTYGNVRITFDSEIRTGLFSTGLLDMDVATLPVGDLGVTILEVKYDNYFPDIIRDMIQTNTRQAEAFSKYTACRIYG